MERKGICRFYHTPSPTSPHSHLGHWGTCRTVTPVYLFPARTRRPPGPTCTNFAVLQMFGDNLVHKCTRRFRTFFVHFANCEMSILSNDAVHLLLQCICDDRGSPWYLSVSGVPRNFFRWGGFNKFSWGQRTERTGIWGGSPLVSGSGGSCNLVQEI